MKAGDLCDALEAPMPQAHGLTCCNPAPLLLIQPAQQQIELPMIFPFRMFTRAASRTPAIVNRPWRAHCPTPSLECPTVYTQSTIHGIDLGRVLSSPERRISPMQLAAQLLEESVQKLAQEHGK
jgi:hypothetical protein